MEEQIAKTKKEKTVNPVKINPLRNERIYVRFVPQKSGLASSDPKHVMFGGLADGAFVQLCVPTLRTGNYKNVLTNEEKDFLEEALGLDVNALSVYNKTNNFWDNYKVRLTKEGLHLDLSDPEDYIRYAVLKANSDIVAPSVEERINRPKNTYKFELVREDEEATLESVKMDAMMQSYKEFGKIESDLDTLRVLIELLDSRPYSATEKIDFLRSRANKLIQADPKKFLSYVTDPLLHAKVLIRRGTELGAIMKRGDFYYLKSDNSPLCEPNEDPTMTVAARYINQPSHQDIKFILESEVGKGKKR